MDYIGISEILSQVERTIETELSAKRLAHCRSTAETSVFLCNRFGLDVEKGRLAGIAHDMCRELVYEEQERIIAQFGSCLDRFHASSSLHALLSDPVYRKKMIHGPAAACMLCHEFGVDDADVLEAGALHSIADNSASDLAKVVYISDKLEPLRQRPPDAETMLHSLNLDALFFYTLANVVRWFKESGKPLSPYTAMLYTRMLES
jgi:nicotinate-nucleotide adenylyltransferase